MPGDEDPKDALRTLMNIHALVSGDDMADFGVSFDKGMLEDLIKQSMAFQERQENPPKTGRRAAIEAQKARKANAE